MQHAKYTDITVTTRYGPVVLTIFTPADAMWKCEQVLRLPENLHGVQSGIVNVGSSFIVVEREPSCSDLRFLCQAYRPAGELDVGIDDPELTVHDYYPITHCL